MLLQSISRRVALIGFIGLSACIGPTLETPDEEPTPEPEATTVVSVLADMPQFSTFSAALESTGLNPVLEGTGPFTLFAPTNDALDTLNLDLAALTPDQMADLLQYHIIAGEMTGNAAENTSRSNTLLQERIHLPLTVSSHSASSSPAREVDDDAGVLKFHSLSLPKVLRRP